MGSFVSLDIERHSDVVRIRMTSAGSRAVGLNVSAYVVRGILIDTGFPRAHALIDRASRELDIRGTIVTHSHEDHAGNVELLARRGVPLCLRSDTEAILRRRPRIKLYRRVVWGRPPALRSPVTPFDPGELAIMATPGHAPDHQIVWDQASDTVFTGDLWLGVRSRAMHHDENPYILIDSLRRVHELRPRRMFDAHRGRIDDASGALLARINWLGDTVGEIERRVSEGCSDQTIVKQVLGGEEMAALLSRGEYARRNLVRAVRRHLASITDA